MPSPSSLVLSSIRKSYGVVEVLHDLDLEVRAGELLTLLGPSGSGKTTLLKVVAGFEGIGGGTIVLGGRDVAGVAPARRGIGMVFQNYALFPHMTVRGNVAFPLEMRRMGRGEALRRVEAALELVGLSGFGERYPRQLSGGQQQRVALARAVVFEPLLLLLDEPFGALDRKLREAMQLEVRALQRRLGITTIFITHDQDEALVMSDRIAVVNAGAIVQVGTPTEVYDRPATAFAADFVGESNFYPGVVAEAGRVRLDNGVVLEAGGDFSVGTRVGAVIRPERLDAVEGTVLEGVVEEVAYLGVAWKYRLRLAGGAAMLVRLPGGLAPEPVGGVLRVRVGARDVHLLRLDR